jgi:hypothetical protein
MTTSLANVNQVNVAGASPVWLGYLSSASAGVPTYFTTSPLGYTRNGSQISFQQFYEDIPGDQNGGDAGPPVEVQLLGQIANVRLMLTKYNPTIFQAAQEIMYNANFVPGTVNPGLIGSANGQQAGSLMFTGGPAGVSQCWAIYIGVPSTTPSGSSTVGLFPWFFPNCLIREPYELNVGTKYSELALSFTAYNLTAAFGSAATGLPLYSNNINTASTYGAV